MSLFSKLFNKKPVGRQCRCGILPVHSSRTVDCVAVAKAAGYKTISMGFIIDKDNPKRFFDGGEWLYID